MCINIFDDFQSTTIEAACINKPNVLHFLVGLYFLRVYQTETLMAGTFKIDEKSVQKYAQKYVLVIQALKGKKVSASLNMLLNHINFFLNLSFFFITRFVGTRMLLAMKSSSSQLTVSIAKSLSPKQILTKAGFHTSSILQRLLMNWRSPSGGVSLSGSMALTSPQKVTLIFIAASSRPKCPLARRESQTVGTLGRKKHWAFKMN